MAPKFRTNKNGKPYPIHEGKGRGRATAVAVGTVLAVSGAGGSVGTGALVGSSGGSASLTAAESAVVRGVRSNLTKARTSVRRGKPKQAWRKLGLRRGRARVREAARCWAFSFGQVQEFFAHTPCRSMRRAQFPVTVADGTTVWVLVSRVRMGSVADAGEFKRLIDVHGTGDIRPILPTVSFSGHNYDSRSSGRTVVVAETEPTAGTPPGPVLESITHAAVVLTPR